MLKSSVTMSTLLQRAVFLATICSFYEGSSAVDITSVLTEQTPDNTFNKFYMCFEWSRKELVMVKRIFNCLHMKV